MKFLAEIVRSSSSHLTHLTIDHHLTLPSLFVFPSSSRKYGTNKADGSKIDRWQSTIDTIDVHIVTDNETETSVMFVQAPRKQLATKAARKSPNAVGGIKSKVTLVISSREIFS